MDSYGRSRRQPLGGTHVIRYGRRLVGRDASTEVQGRKAGGLLMRRQALGTEYESHKGFITIIIIPSVNYSLFYSLFFILHFLPPCALARPRNAKRPRHDGTKGVLSSSAVVQ